jgi:hypothetical protein
MRDLELVIRNTNSIINCIQKNDRIVVASRLIRSSNIMWSLVLVSSRCPLPSPTLSQLKVAAFAPAEKFLVNKEIHIQDALGVSLDYFLFYIL